MKSFLRKIEKTRNEGEKALDKSKTLCYYTPVAFGRREETADLKEICRNLKKLLDKWIWVC